MRAAAQAHRDRRLRRVAVLVTAVTALLLVPAPAASAHGRGSDATNFESRILSTPDVPGARWAVHGGDELLELRSPEVELTVLGYSGEPYVRVGPDGAFRNRHSPATYLNEDRYRTQLPPDVTADPSAEPSWERVSSTPRFAWHDHRTHRMTTALPSAVSSDPGTARLIQEWSVPVVVGGRAGAVDGELHWVPGPSPWPWLLAGVVVALPALAGLRSRGARALARPAALVLGAVALANLTRVVDDVAAMPLPVTTIVFAAVQTVLFIAIGLLGAVKAWRGGDGAFTGLAVGAAAVLIGQGLLQLSVLSASQLTSVFPTPLSRLVTAASIGQALTVGAVALVGNRRILAQAEQERAVPVGG